MISLSAGNCESIVIAIVFTVGIVLFTDGLPRVTWHFFALYFLGAFVWLPTYWYMTLRGNRMKLLEVLEDETWDHYKLNKHGEVRDGRMVPNHPSKESLAANGLLWFFAAPIFIAENWIRWIIDLSTRLMNKAQLALAVDVPVKYDSNGCRRDSK